MESEVEYVPQHASGLRALAAKFRRKAFVTRSLEEQRAVGGEELKRCLSQLDLLLLGVGGIVGGAVGLLAAGGTADSPPCSQPPAAPSPPQAPASSC